MTISEIDLLGLRVATAVAAYGELDRNNLNVSLTRPEGNAKFTSAQAVAFTARYELVDQLPNVQLNGFSAAVFLDKLRGNHVIAMQEIGVKS